MIKRSLYLDTTIPSYYCDQREELDIRYRRKVTRDWWTNEKDSFDLYVPEIITPLQLFKETGDENER